MQRMMLNRFMAVFLVFMLIIPSFPQINYANEGETEDLTFEDLVKKGSYNPHEDYLSLDVRFWEDEAPDVGFYINHANLYNLTTVSEPGFGTSHGEWTVMDLLRGLYGGYYYNEKLSESYFDGYIKRVEEYVESKNGLLDRNKSTEWSRALLSLTALGYDVTDVAGYDFIEKLSESYSFSFRQGINGPIWEIIALNTAPYDLYEDSTNEDQNTIGKMIDYILDNEIEQNDGTLGGWALANFGNAKPDVDITGMALQALAPYYKNQALFDATDSEYSYEEFAKAVERGVVVLSDMQLDNGGFPAFGNVNSESTVQAIVALTALDIDPLTDKYTLPHIKEEVGFITEGAVHDNVETDNMIDKLLTFWAPGTNNMDTTEMSEEDKEIYRISGGFKHVTSGNDGGGGSGTSVNGMATDQAIYGLIAYDRYKKGLNDLYDMSDMVNGEYKDMLKAENQNITLNSSSATQTITGKRYDLVKLPEAEAVEGEEFAEWNTKEDGTGTAYETGEYLVVPEKDVALYAQYDYESYAIHFELNEGSFIADDIPTEYTTKDEITLPSDNEVYKDGYTFAGWYEDESFSGEKIEKIEKGSTGDKTYYAKWEEVKNDEEIAGKEVKTMIDNLPSVDQITLNDKEKVEEARLAYDSLSTEAKEYVTNYTKLEVLESKIAELELEAEIDEERNKLQNKIDEALDLNIESFTKETAELLGEAVGHAENLLLQTDQYTEEYLLNVTTALQELNEAISSVEEKTEDEELNVSRMVFELARLANYNLDQLSGEKQKEVEQLLEDASNLLEDASATQEEVDDLVAKIQETINNFDELVETIDKTKLEEVIDFAKNIDTTNVVEDSINHLSNAIEKAEAVLQNDSATQEEVEEAISNLEKVISELEYIEENKVNKDDLEKVLEGAQDIDVSKKTTESVEKFKQAKSKAEEVLANEDATQEEVDEALYELLTAIDHLEEKEIKEEVDKTDLENAYNESKNLSLKNKTLDCIIKLATK